MPMTPCKQCKITLLSTDKVLWCPNAATDKCPHTKLSRPPAKVVQQIVAADKRTDEQDPTH